MLVYYISEPKQWSPSNVGMNPYLYLSIQDPTEKCPVFLNQCFSMSVQRLKRTFCEPP